MERKEQGDFLLLRAITQCFFSITNTCLRHHMLLRGLTILQRQQQREAQSSCSWPVQMTNSGKHLRKL